MVYTWYIPTIYLVGVPDAIESRRVTKLKEAFKAHLGLENKFVRSKKTKGWNKVSLYGYKCWRFAEQDENGVSKIIAETRACGGPFDDLSSVGPHLSNDLLDLRDPALVLLCKAPALVAVERYLVPALGLLGAHKLIPKAQMCLNASLSFVTLLDSMARPNISLTSASVGHM
jgi:hypothetical protein